MKMHVPLGKPQPWVLPMTIVCLVFGGFIAVLTSVISEDAPVDTTQFTKEQLSALYAETMMKADALRKENKILRSRANQYTNSAVGPDKALQQQIDELRILAGATAVKGPGILITLDDTGNIKNSPFDPNASLRVVHDSDLYVLVNVLRAARAEAIEINGQRITASTAIVCSGPVIQVNEMQVAPPFHISAIGKTDTLYGAVNMPGGNLEMMRMVGGIQVKVEKRAELLITASTLSHRLVYGKPVLEEPDESVINR